MLESHRAGLNNIPPSLSVNLPSCGWSLNASMQMTSLLENLTMAIWPSLMNRGRGLLLSGFPVFLSTSAIRALSVTSFTSA